MRLQAIQVKECYFASETPYTYSQMIFQRNLCPELGSKGSIPYDQVKLSNLSSFIKSLVEYMKQDILLLGGIMHNFQDLYAKAYKADIEKK